MAFIQRTFIFFNHFIGLWRASAKQNGCGARFSLFPFPLLSSIPVHILTSQHITWVINASALTFIQCLKVEILLVEFFRTDMCRCVHIKYTSTTLDYPATTFIGKIYSFLLPIQKISFTHDAFCWKQMKEKRT